MSDDTAISPAPAPVPTAVPSPAAALDDDACDHRWAPIPNWYARYRCEACGAHGYKQRVVTCGAEPRSRGEGPVGRVGITPYVCSVKRAGVACGGVAVEGRPNKWKCRHHAAAPATRRARQLTPVAEVAKTSPASGVPATAAAQNQLSSRAMSICSVVAPLSRG